MPLRYLTAGESHGPGLTAILEGMPAGLPISLETIQEQLTRRQTGYGAGSRMAFEHDQAEIHSGVMEGRTTGGPIAIYIVNQDHKNWVGKSIPAQSIPRPGHADLAGTLKYGYSDLRPALERASARETAARVALGAICRTFLTEFGIVIGGYVVSIGEISGSLNEPDLEKRYQSAELSDVRHPDPETSKKMHHAIRKAIEKKDTLGGVIEVFALNLPPGLGSFVQWDRKLDARIGAVILSIPAIKGVEFGSAFENTKLPGTKAQDPIQVSGNALIRPTNRSGGLEAGVTNGQPLIVRAAMKPIATTLKTQESVDLKTGEPGKTQYQRSDYCPVPRAVPILEAALAIVLADAILEKLGGDSLQELQIRYRDLRKSQLSDLHIEGSEHTFWGGE